MFGTYVNENRRIRIKASPLLELLFRGDTSLKKELELLDSEYLLMALQEYGRLTVRHWTRRLHLGSNIETLEFCPSDRVILTTSREWGVMATKLNVPADWKEF
ncbi:hypothetical protein Leryth_008291 [Lithospermum erythrorhizon]|nr:hypothetical protein Leryth_008291 [Lithospermum erythrorhizon]